MPIALHLTSTEGQFLAPPHIPGILTMMAFDWSKVVFVCYHVLHTRTYFSFVLPKVTLPSCYLACGYLVILISSHIYADRKLMTTVTYLDVPII